MRYLYLINISLLIGALFEGSSASAYVVRVVTGEVRSGPYYNPTITRCRRTAAWPTGTAVKWFRNLTSFPDGSNSTKALISAWSRWNSGAANINISTVGDSGGVAFDDGKNSIWFSTRDTEGFPGVAYVSYSNRCNIKEADIIFNANGPWTFFENAQHEPFKERPRNFTGVAVHEFGHALGLEHEDRYYNIMGADSSHLTRGYNSDTFYGPGEDGNNGLVALYGAASGRPDIGLTVMRYEGIDGEYSTHKFGGIRTTSGVLASSCPIDKIGGQKCYSVVKGKTYQMEVTVENNGTAGAPSSIPINIYLNSKIDLSVGSFLVTRKVTVSRDVPYETKLSFTVPATAASKTYFFVSAEYAPPSGYSDRFSKNNAAFIPIYVQ